MSNGISKPILDAIRQKAQDDKQIENFLISLLIKESRCPEHWQYKEFYRKTMKSYLGVWRGLDENQEGSA